MKKALLTLLVLSTFFLASCDGHTSVSGYVYDGKGQPIEDALVVLEEHGRKFEIRTRKDGSFDVGVTHAPTEVQLTFTVSKEGYKPHKESFSSRKEPERGHRIVLDKISADDNEGVKEIKP